jgi:alkanesulfonate monooxygenase SsuD/methylene tetrahydromethanopterin reductase-like flavin-dependent oxidoreductase (luciferase family)
MTSTTSSDSTMRYGFVLPGGSAREQLELAELADRCGWDGIFVWEAAFGVDAWSLLSAMAVRTEHVRLGTLLTPLPWRRPWKVASQLVTLDQLSGGRAILAVGLGAVDAQLGGTGEITDKRHRAELLDDGLDIIDALLAGTQTFDGRHYHIDLHRPEMYGVARPVQQPRPPIWIVGLWGSAKSMHRVPRGDGLLPNLPGGQQELPVDAVADMRRWLDEHAPDGRRLDLVAEGETPAEDPEAARAKVAAFEAAGATWWIEARWSGDLQGEATVDGVRRRIEAGPPKAR